MRLDRSITLGVVQPFKRAVASWQKERESPCSHRTLPILMYHSISRSDETGVPGYYQLCTPPRVFSEHVAMLKAEGFQGVGVSDGLAWLNASGDALPPHHGETKNSGSGAKRVAITFDDGYRDFYEHAYPILRAFGFSATVFLPTEFIDDERRQFKSHECMTWREVRELHQSGIEFGSHTAGHPILKDLGWLDIERELRESKVALERQLGGSVRAFAYPYAFPQIEMNFISRLRDVLVASGYQSCVTTIIGRVALGNDPYMLKRLPVNGSDDARLLLAKLRGAYDWLGPLQRVTGRMKRLLAHTVPLCAQDGADGRARSNQLHGGA